MTDKGDEDRVARDRRKFLMQAGVVVPPTMVMLLSTSMVSPAIAASGSGGDGGVGPFLPLAIPIIGAAASTGPGPVAPVLAAVPESEPGSPSAFGGPAAAPTPFAAPVGSAPIVVAQAPSAGSPRAVGKPVPVPRRTLAIRKAGERG